MALTDNLLAFYKLSDLTDSSGNNRTLTNNGNVSFASGKIGNAAVFDGTNYLTGPSGLGSNFEQITISCWIYRSDDSILSRFISNEAGGGYNWGLYGDEGTNSSNFYLYTANGSVNNFFDVELNEYIFVTGVYDGQTFKVYKNGTLAVSDIITGSIQESSSLLQIGGAYDSGALNGKIDAVGIWNRALSDSEVAALYNSGTGLELPAAPAVKNGWIDNIFWINDIATSLDQNGDGKWQGKLYENGALFSGTKYSLTFVDGLAQPENIVTVIGNSVPVAFGLNEAEEPLIELVFASITSAGETVIEQIVPTVLPTGYTVAETVLAYSIDTTATFEGSINVDFVLPSNISQAAFDRVKGFHVKNNGTIEEMARVSSDFSTKRITVAITSFSDFLFLDEPQNNKSVKVVGKSKFVGKVKFA